MLTGYSIAALFIAAGLVLWTIGAAWALVLRVWGREPREMVEHLVDMGGNK